MPSKRTNSGESVPSRIFRLLAGLVILAGAILFFASGWSPPGALGDVLRHNQQHDIDASPLIYTEVENMVEIQLAVRRMRQEARMATATESASQPAEQSQNSSVEMQE